MDRNGGKWTEARFRGFVVSALRQAGRRWPPKYETVKDACTGVRINKKTKREGRQYRCALCEKDFSSTQIQVDHIVPIGHCDSWDQFIERLFCEKNNLQVLCRPCHKKKTKMENKKK